MTQPNGVFCELEGCQNTAFFRFNGVAICCPCIDAMAVMNSDNEQALKAALAVAEPIQDCPWLCEVCGTVWDSFHIRNGVCNDCRSAQPYLWIN